MEFALSPLTATSPIDGRYRNKTKELAPYFSEYGLIRYRLQVEVRYLRALKNQAQLPQLQALPGDFLETLAMECENLPLAEAEAIKNIEKTTNHDVKAVEYYLRQRFENAGYGHFAEWIHFGLTSQDINNTAVPMALSDALDAVYLEVEQNLESTLESKAEAWGEIPLLAHTHGQPASPTTLGKEIGVFAQRLGRESGELLAEGIPAKFGGATGNFNAHYAAFPNTDWFAFAEAFLSEHLGLVRSPVTTQIDHYDGLAAIFHRLQRINTILLDFSRDMWLYISMNYFTQQVAQDEVGSSAMPHKVNPIDFENAEGNLGLANAIFGHLAEKLPVSRLQRDLSDSTVLRNIGTPMAHSLIALYSLQKGIDRVRPNQDVIGQDLEHNWAVVAEGIQTILRREGYKNPYELLKQLTRTGKPIDQAAIQSFIEGLEVAESVKEELRNLSPHTYLGRNEWLYHYGF